MSDTTQKRTKVLFLAWGESIHARRRISLFTEDPAFEVAVVSTFNYAFPNARNVMLTEACPQPMPVAPRCLPWRVVVAIGRYLAAFLAAWKIFKSSGVLAEAGGALRHLLLIKTAFFTPETRYDVQLAVKDFRILQQTVEEFEPEVIFLQTLLYPCYLSNFLPRQIPVIITFWNGDVTWWAQWRGLERLLKKQMVTYGVQRAKAMTVNSRAAYEACLAYGVAADNIHLIRYPGVDMGRFYPDDKKISRQKLGILNDHVVFAPRGLGGYLNSEVIVEAAALVVTQFPDVLFVIACAVAPGDELETHKSKAKNLCIEKNFLWVPKIAWEDMPNYYNAADAMVSISSNDSLPNCMLEAMACGIPVIMGDIPQLQEWIKDGENGFFVPTRDPKILAERIVAVLQNQNHFVDVLMRNALTMVAENVDSRRTIPMVKKLTLDIARAAGHA